MRLPKFAYFAPKTVPEALTLLADQGEGGRLMAGGTDVVVKMSHGLLKPNAIIDIQRIEGLGGIRFHETDGLTIGALARLGEVTSHPDIVRHYPSLSYAVSCMANVEVRNMGTVAGNICNAAPSADTAPPLITMNAEVTLSSLQGERTLSINDFFRGPGLTAMERGEILTSIHIPAPLSHSGASYKRISARCGVDIAAVCVGVHLVIDGQTFAEARIVLGAVAPLPMRAIKTEALLKGQVKTADMIRQAGDQAAEEAKPISDMRSSAEWRKNMVAVLTRRALEEAFDRANKG